MKDSLLKLLKICSFCIIVFVACFTVSVTAAASGDGQIKKLKKTKITSIAATDEGTVELKWNKVSGANRYIIYRKKSGDNRYIRVTSVKNTKYVDKKGKANATYFYRIQPINRNDDKKVLARGESSTAKKCKVRKKNPKIAYAGDSIMTGFTCYNILKGKKNCKVFAAVGANPKKYISSSEMTALLKYNPDRLYIMLGVNSLWSSDSSWLNSLWTDYEKILQKCRKKNPNMEIVVVGVAPVGKKASISKSAVNKFNKILKEKVSKKSGMYYCDMTSYLADSNGYLLSKYSAGDGVHWQIKTYSYVLEKWNKFSEKIYW